MSYDFCCFCRKPFNWRAKPKWVIDAQARELLGASHATCIETQRQAARDQLVTFYVETYPYPPSEAQIILQSNCRRLRLKYRWGYGEDVETNIKIAMYLCEGNRPWMTSISEVVKTPENHEVTRHWIKNKHRTRDEVRAGSYTLVYLYNEIAKEESAPPAPYGKVDL